MKLHFVMSEDVCIQEATSTGLPASLRASADWPHEVAVPFPFDTVDAAFVARLNATKEMRYKRQTTSAGSAIYALRLGSLAVGTFQLRAVLAGSTHINLQIAPIGDDKNEFTRLFIAGHLPALLWAVVEQLSIEARAMERLIETTEAMASKISPVVVRVPPEVLDQTQQPEKVNEPPAPDAPIDAWLDWRESQIKQGRSTHSVSFSQLAKSSNYSVSQFKHASAKRNRTKT